MKTKIGILKASLATAVVLAGAQAYANTIAFFARPGNFTFGGQVFVPLNSAGATQVTYSGSGRRTITYTAECANNAANATSWVTISIIVDGVALAPTGANVDDAFCTSNGSLGHDGWIMASATGRTASLPAGTHTVRVLAQTSGGGGWLGDSGLLIQR